MTYAIVCELFRCTYSFSLSPNRNFFTSMFDCNWIWNEWIQR